MDDGSRVTCKSIDSFRIHCGWPNFVDKWTKKRNERKKKIVVKTKKKNYSTFGGNLHGAELGSVHNCFVLLQLSQMRNGEKITKNSVTATWFSIRRKPKLHEFQIDGENKRKRKFGHSRPICGCCCGCCLRRKWSRRRNSVFFFRLTIKLKVLVR